MRTQKMAAKVFRLTQRAQKLQWLAQAEGFGQVSQRLSDVVVDLMMVHEALKPPAPPQIISDEPDYGSPFTED